MPFLIPAIVVIGGIATIWGASSAGTAIGDEAGQGLNKGITIVGIATGVGIVIYALHKSGVKL
jgi:hypothetical protein